MMITYMHPKLVILHGVWVYMVCGREAKTVHARYNRKLMLPCSYCAGRSGTVFV